MSTTKHLRCQGPVTQTLFRALCGYMHMFLEERALERGGGRISLENFSRYEKIETCPLYAMQRLGLSEGV